MRRVESARGGKDGQVLLKRPTRLGLDNPTQIVGCRRVDKVGSRLMDERLVEKALQGRSRRRKISLYLLTPPLSARRHVEPTDCSETPVQSRSALYLVKSKKRATQDQLICLFPFFRPLSAFPTH